MFTGIIQSMGRIEQLTTSEKGTDIVVRVSQLEATHYHQWTVGASVAVNGVCLTVTSKDSDQFAAQISLETLQKSTFANLKVGSIVNLEAPLRAGDFLGGHWVSGHVDDVAEIIHISKEGFSKKIDLAARQQWLKYLTEKGSITIDGVSLTINTAKENIFSINAVPHTLESTTIGRWEKGLKVNLEIDMLVRYVLNAQ